jgi:glycosyltransferase involved in cell wall biosynthesis
MWRPTDMTGVRGGGLVHPPTSISLVYRDREGMIDGIGDYCERLESALRAAGIDARTLAWRSRGVDADTGAVILQYNPFSFGRWGFAPRLAFDMIALRRQRPDIRQAVMVHEPFVRIESAKSLVMGTWQRLQLRAVLSAADVVMVSTSSWIPLLPARSRPVTAPVGSNLPDRREWRQTRRQALGADGGALVLATFGTDHPSRLMDHVVAATNAVAARHQRVTLLCLGVGTPALEGLDRAVAVHRPGRQQSDELATELSAADVYLAPFADGLTTRRTTLMAALQHALPVVGIDGPRTEAELRSEEAAIRWTPAGEPRRFADAALELADDAALRQRSGVAARELYERRFSWEVVAGIVVDALSSPRGAGGSAESASAARSRAGRRR